MNLKDLINFFNNPASKNVFLKKIDDEVETYKNVSKKKGSSVNIKLDCNEYDSFEVTKSNVRTLGELFLQSHLDQWHVSYICDAILLSENVSFQNERVQNAIEEMTDPEINGELTTIKAQTILNNL